MNFFHLFFLSGGMYRVFHLTASSGEAPVLKRWQLFPGPLLRRGVVPVRVITTVQINLFEVLALNRNT